MSSWVNASERAPKEGQLIVAYYAAHDRYWVGHFERRMGFTLWFPLTRWFPLDPGATLRQCAQCRHLVDMNDDDAGVCINCGGRNPRHA